MRIITPLAFLVACARQPTVSDAMLVYVPAEVVERVEPLRLEAESLDRRIAEAEIAVEETRMQEDAQLERLDVASEALGTDEKLKELAIRRGDQDAVSSADQRIRETQAALEVIRGDAAEAALDRMQAEAELELLRAERDLVLARIELERARGIASVEPINLQKFERAVYDALDRREAAAQRQMELGVSAPPMP
jgi:hypothetical protein